MARLMLNDEYWSKLRRIIRDHGVYDKPNLRMMIEDMLYRMRVGCPWRYNTSIQRAITLICHYIYRGLAIKHAELPKKNDRKSFYNKC